MCDTFVVLPPFTADGSVIFGKNSDREPNEAQALEFHPAQAHPAGQTVKCTYLEIPQVRETHAVLLSRPFWMWGAEMGANEKGVVIGNEAVFTKMPLDRKGGLTGMDLLRLALERADTAEQAVETVIQLLADHGQGGICGYEDKRMTYHNSFICADPKGAWVLETAGPLWVRRRVDGFASISNGLTIGEAFDACHPDAIETAKRKGWLKSGETFDFSRCFSDWFYTTFSASRNRQSRSLGLIHEGETQKDGQGIDVPSVLRVLRDHQGDVYRPDGHLLCDRLCAHAANRLSRNATQSTGSLGRPPEDRPSHLLGDGHIRTLHRDFQAGLVRPQPLAGHRPDAGRDVSPQCPVVASRKTSPERVARLSCSDNGLPGREGCPGGRIPRQGRPGRLGSAVRVDRDCLRAGT